MTRVIRIVLGIFLLTMGINKMLTFLPDMGLAPDARNFMIALVETGYMLKMVAVVEISCGVLLLSSYTAPFAAILLAPLSVNIILFHLFLDPATILFAAFVFLANVYLGIEYFSHYRPIFSKLLGETVTISKVEKDFDRPVKKAV